MKSDKPGLCCVQPRWGFATYLLSQLNSFIITRNSYLYHIHLHHFLPSLFHLPDRFSARPITTGKIALNTARKTAPTRSAIRTRDKKDVGTDIRCGRTLMAGGVANWSVRASTAPVRHRTPAPARKVGSGTFARSEILANRILAWTGEFASETSISASTDRVANARESGPEMTVGQVRLWKPFKWIHNHKN